jgi:beta-galactosidase
MKHFTLRLVLLIFIIAACSGCNLFQAPMTLKLEMTDGANIPLQSGRPMISFEPQDRPVINLGGVWKKKRVVVDHELSLSMRSSSFFKKIESETLGAYKTGFNDASWETHTVPGVENVMPPTPDNSNGPELYENGIYYRKSIFVPEGWRGRTVRLVSLGADYIADLWVNGEWAGYHEGGYSPFALNISEKLIYGSDNVIFFRIDPMEWKLRQDIMPTYFATDWMHYAGLVQDVYLEAAPAVNVVRADVIPKDTAGNVDVSVVAENNSKAAIELTARISVNAIDNSLPGYLTDPVAAHVAGAPAALSGQTEKTFEIKAGGFARKGFMLQVMNLRLWSPAEPSLYVMKVELFSSGLLIDSFSTQFGIRTVVVGAGARMLLNGRPIFFTGMARHEDWPDSGRTATFEKIVGDLKIIKDTKVRFLRSGHYPNHPYTYLMTDRLGLAVWEEIPAWWINSVSIDKLTQRGLAKQMLREMCFNERNNPSVILWSVANEPMYYLLTTEKLKRYVRELHDDLDQNYPDGRLLTFSLAADGVKTTGGAVEEVDVAGFTMYYGVFYGSYVTTETMQFLNEQHSLYPDKPIIACEFGTWPDSNGNGELDQVMIAEETLDGLLPLAAVDTSGNETGGFLASAVWWCQFNWYRVDKEAPVQNMGVTKMDRTTHKAARSTLIKRFKPYFDMGGVAR